MLKEIKKKKHNLTTDEEKQWEAEKKCYICGDKFLNSVKAPTTKDDVLTEIQDLLEKNMLPTEKIPSLKLVKKQQRTFSRLLHPDKNLDVSKEAQNKKEEEFKIFFQANKKLQKILIEKGLINNVEEDEE